jgi:hypothetical protein
MKPYPTTNTPVFNATSDEAAVASAEDIKKQEALRKAQENARAYAEGRTPKQEEEREFDRQKARDSAITALGQIDRSNEPVGFRQIMENKALQQAAIAQANPNMFGDLGAPNTMQEELEAVRRATPDPYADDVIIPQNAMDYLNAINADTSDPSKTKTMADNYLRGRGDLQAPSSIGGGAEAQMLAEGRPMTEAEYLFNMQRQQDAIKDAGGFIPPNIGAIELNQPSVQRGLADEAGRIRASNELVKQLQQEAAGMQPFDISNQDPNFAGVLAAQDQKSRFADAAAAAENSRRLMAERGMLKSQRENMARILSGGPQGMDFNANLASPELDENVAGAIESRQRREAAERVALKDATGQSIKSAAPIGNYGQVAADALRADVDVRDAELGGAFAKGDEGIERKLLGFGPFQQSTSEIIQDQLDENLERDSIKALSETELFGNQGPMAANEVKIAAQEQELFGNQGPKASSPKSVSIRDTSGESTGNNALDRRMGLGVYSDPYRNPIMDNVIPQLVDTKVDENATPYQDVYDVVMGNTAADSLNTEGPFTPNEDTRITRMKVLADQISSGELNPTALEFAKKDLERLRAAVERTGGQDTIEDYFSNQILGPALRGAEKYGVKGIDFAVNELGIGNLISQAAGPRIAGAISDYTSENAANADDMRIAANTTGNEVEAEAIVSALGLTPSDAGSAGEGTTDQAVKADKTQTQAAEDETTSDTSLAGSIDEAVNTGAAANALPTVRDTDDSKGGTSTKSGTGSSASSQIIDLLKSQEASADSDKWLALANAGMALMSSKQPTLGGALGEAGQVGIAGLMKSRQAADAAKLKTLKFQAGLEAAAAKSGLPKDRYKDDVSLFNNTSDNIRGLLTQKGASSPADFLNAAEGTGPDEISEDDKAQLVYLIKIQRDAAKRLGYNNPPPVKKIS